MTAATLRVRWCSLGDFGESLDALLTCLSAEERERASRFQVAAARRRFVIGRTLLRRELGAAVGADPTALAFSTGNRGKPLLATPGLDDPPRFNLSHSGDLVAAVFADVEVGVDVEELRSVPTAERLARRFYSPAECAALHGLDGGVRDRAFLRIWTRKEAYLKATGLGVGMPLREVETDPDLSKPPRLIAVGGDTAEAARWTLLDARVPNAVCTAAVQGPAPALEIRRWMPELEVV
jgi:4'-phosphopantetheinyl transferase